MTNDNGLITKIWGPHFWVSLHCVTFGFPIMPTENDKKNYRIYFESLANVLPCKYCQVSYTHFINSEPTKLTDDIFSSRDTLTKWLYLLHERVNKKLGVDYDVPYEQVVEKYESFRATCSTNKPKVTGCSMPANTKAKSYQNDSYKNCPIVCIEIARALSDYAIKRGVSFDKIEFYNNLKKSNKSHEWLERNNYCKKMIYEMRLKGIPSVEIDGPFKGLPTINELMLISKLCTNMSKNELIAITKLLNKPVKFNYKLKSLNV